MVDISNIVNISVASSSRALGEYNVNNLMYITTATPISVTPWTEAYRVYKDAASVGVDFGTDSAVFKNAAKVFAQKPNILAGGGSLIIAPMVTTVVEETPVVETISEAITRLSKLVYWGGMICDKTATDSEIIAAATVNEGLDSIYFVCASSTDALSQGGLLYTLSAAKNEKTKLLMYTMDGDAGALAFACAYASRGMSVNFNAQNSTITMNLKELSGLLADTNITETVYASCSSLGVDVYTGFGGLPKIVSNGNDLFFDDIYNRIWFVVALKVALFNSLATTSTKIPQTEQGVDKIKARARQVCQRGVYNGFIAAGTWNGTDTFGSQDDFYRNIEDFGYFVYSAPVSSQSQEERESRVSPVIQVACKQAGAIHKIDLIVKFEA